MLSIRIMNSMGADRAQRQILAAAVGRLEARTLRTTSEVAVAGGTGSLYTLRRSGPNRKLGFTISMLTLSASGAHANRHKLLANQVAPLKRKTASIALLGHDQD